MRIQTNPGVYWEAPAGQRAEHVLEQLLDPLPRHGAGNKPPRVIPRAWTPQNLHIQTESGYYIAAGTGGAGEHAVKGLRNLISGHKTSSAAAAEGQRPAPPKNRGFQSQMGELPGPAAAAGDGNPLQGAQHMIPGSQPAGASRQGGSQGRQKTQSAPSLETAKGKKTAPKKPRKQQKARVTGKASRRKENPQQKTRKTLVVACWNVRGWNAVTDAAEETTVDQLARYLYKYKPDIMAITETWFDIHEAPDAGWLSDLGYVWMGCNATLRTTGHASRPAGGVGFLCRAQLAGTKQGSGFANVKRCKAIQNAGGHTGTLWATVKLRASSGDGTIQYFNVGVTYLEHHNCKLIQDRAKVWDAVEAEATARKMEHPAIWVGDFNGHTAAAGEGPPGTVAVPPRQGCRLPNGDVRPTNGQGRKLLEMWGKLHMKIINGRKLGAASGGWHWTRSGTKKNKVKTYTTIDYIVASHHLMSKVRNTGVDPLISMNSDHRMIWASFETNSYTQPKIEEPIKHPPTIKWNLRLLQDTSPGGKKDQFSAGVAEQLTEKKAEWQASSAATKSDMFESALFHSLETNIGKIKTTGYAKAKGGKAVAWHTKELKELLARKLQQLRRKQKVLQGRASVKVKLEARKQYAELVANVNTACRQAKRKDRAKKAKFVQDAPHAKAMWSALRALNGDPYAPPAVYQVDHPVTGARTTTVEGIANAHTANLSMLGAARPPSSTVAAAAAEAVRKLDAVHQRRQDNCAQEAFDVCVSEEAKCPALSAGHKPAAGADVLNTAFTQKEVVTALEQCNRNTAPGKNEITYEVIKALLESGSQQGDTGVGVEYPTNMYNAVLDEGKVPKAWKHGEVSMLYKKGSTAKCSNYRGITLLNVIGKIFDRIITARLSTHLELGTGAAEQLVYLLHENQNGFRWNRSCEEHVFTLQQAIESNKGAVGVFVDIRKAYPTVFREGLFLKLAQKGITGKTWRVLRDMYDGLTSQVKVAGQLATDEGSDGIAAGVYEVETGLMEGAILSPLLYTVFIDGLARALEETGLGCRVYGKWVGALYYADDLCLLAPNDDDMQKMLDVLHTYCKDWEFEPSYDKTKVVHFDNKPAEHAELYLKGMHGAPNTGSASDDRVGRTDQYPYLGIIFSSDCKFTKHVRQVVVPKMRQAKERMRKYKSGMDGMNVTQMSTVLRAVVEPHMMYCAAVWAPVPADGGDKRWGVATSVANDVAVAFAAASRQALGADEHVHLSAVYLALGLNSPEHSWALAVLRLSDRITRQLPHRLPLAAYQAALSDGRQRPRRNRTQVTRFGNMAEAGSVTTTSGLGTMNTFRTKLLEAHSLIYGSKGSVQRYRLKSANGKHKQHEYMTKQAGLAMERTWKRHIQQHQGTELYLIAPPPSVNMYLKSQKAEHCSPRNFRFLTAMRTQGHHLLSLDSEYGLDTISGDREDPSLCRECDQEVVEDEMHFMCRCPVYSTLRERLYDRLELIYPGWHMLHTSLPDDTWRVTDLLWHIPDGITPAACWLWCNAEQREERRVSATRAIVSYLAEAHKVNSRLRNMYYRL